MDNRGVGSSNNKINWFPGHMTASLRGLDGYIKQCDVILYVLDARCPKSSLNPSFEKFTNRKPVLFVYNKSDLAPKISGKGVFMDSTKSGASQRVVQEIKRMFPTKNRVHAMVIGVPNSGKSTLINNLVGSGKTKTADKPGVTRQPQWVTWDSVVRNAFQLFLLDTPGILYPNLEDQVVARNLAFVGSIKDDILDIIELSRQLLDVIGYGKTLEEFAKARGHILRGNELDLNRSARTVLIEFRAGKFGKFNLDALTKAELQ